MYQKRLFFVVALITAGVLARPLMAAPTVKKLGGTTSDSFAGKGIPARTLTLNQRAPSLRLSNAATKSTTITNDTKNTTQKKTSAADSARLPGLHGNLLKGLSTKLSENNKSSGGKDNSDLLQRVIDLEADMATKQESLEPGNGIDINGNQISLTEEMATLPEKIDTINQDIDDLNDKIEAAGLSDDYYTKEQIETHYYNKAYLDPILSQISSANIADEFVPDFLHQGQNQNPKAQP